MHLGAAFGSYRYGIRDPMHSACEYVCESVLPMGLGSIHSKVVQTSFHHRHELTRGLLFPVLLYHLSHHQYHLK